MVKTREFGQPVARVPQPGHCRVCGCTDIDPCFNQHPDRYCSWADDSRTLCDGPACIAEAKRELGIFAEGESRA